MKTFKLATLAAALVLATAAQAQIKIANIVELSGPGTTSGTMFKPR
jgi:branched-chain amino acid transport system substrate-binding protein